MTKGKKRSQKALKKELWQLCRKLADIKYPNKNCYTCGRPIEKQNKQLGHFIPSSTSGANLRWDLRNLRWQCYFCNINLGGNGAAFYRKMVQEVGQEAVDQLFRDKEKITKLNDQFLIGKIEEYKKLLP